MSHPSNLAVRTYEPALDGLRALAVTVVMAHHVSSRLVPGGWLGVDLFFVLSGYLITSLLSREISLTGNVRLINFYMRRILRLTPALWLLLMVSAGIILASEETIKGDMQAVMIAGLYAMNWTRAFDMFPQGFLGHTWSLAMEEQFYLIWPSFMLLLHGKGRVFWVLACIAVVTVWRCCLAVSQVGPERIYNGFDTHGDALLIGCTLALLPIGAQAAGRARSLVAFPIAGAVLMLAGAAYQTLFAQTIGFTLASLFSAWLIVAVSQPSWFRRLLSTRFLVYTGRISYGLYLWHYPLLSLSKKIPLLEGGVGRVFVALLAYPIAALSYEFVERPFLKMKPRFETNGRGPARLRKAAVQGEAMVS